MAEQLLPYCEFGSNYDMETDRVVLHSRVRVIRSGPAVMEVDDIVNSIIDDPFGYH